MLNHRLEDLIVLYKNYQIKLFVKKLIMITIFVLLFLSIYLIYKTIKHIQNKTSHHKNIIIDKKDTNNSNNSINNLKSIKRAEEFVKIDENDLLDKNTIITLQAIEKDKPTYTSAMDLAKYYFEKKDYKNSAKWALIATNRMPKNDEAWILYANSKIKLNQKGVAKKALKIYLLKYNSQKVINLLNSL